MNYTEAKNKVNSLYREIFNVYLEAIKDYVKTHGEKRSMFCETLLLNVSGLEIVCKETERSITTIDELYYIPSKDELGFIVWNDDTHNSTYLQKEFKPGYTTGLMTDLFYNLCY